MLKEKAHKSHSPQKTKQNKNRKEKKKNKHILCSVVREDSEPIAWPTSFVSFSFTKP